MCDAVYHLDNCSWCESELCCIFHSAFEAPDPSYRLVADSVSNLVAEVHRSLKLGVNLNCSFSVAFRVDVFNFLFNGKGSVPPSGRGNFFELADFSNVYFPANWYVVYDKLGNGCTVVFPVRLESKVRYSSPVYSKKSDGSIVLIPKTFTEMIYVSLVKARC